MYVSMINKYFNLVMIKNFKTIFKYHLYTYIKYNELITYLNMNKNTGI